MDAIGVDTVGLDDDGVDVHVDDLFCTVWHRVFRVLSLAFSSCTDDFETKF
jgi:hypothetical protein